MLLGNGHEMKELICMIDNNVVGVSIIFIIMKGWSSSLLIISILCAKGRHAVTLFLFGIINISSLYYSQSVDLCLNSVNACE